MSITKDQFLAYESVRQSGVTNMFNAKLVSELSGLTKEEVLEIMKNYGSLSKKYLKD
jgi:hypothetical protein